MKHTYRIVLSIKKPDYLSLFQPLHTPLANLLPPELAGEDVREMFPEFRPGKVLRFSRLFRPAHKYSMWRKKKGKQDSESETPEQDREVETQGQDREADKVGEGAAEKIEEGAAEEGATEGQPQQPGKSLMCGQCWQPPQIIISQEGFRKCLRQRVKATFNYRA